MTRAVSEDHHSAAATVDPDHDATETTAPGAMPTRLDTPWELSRDALTAGFFLVAYAAYGLLLAGSVDMARRRGYREAAGHAVLWGAAGFAVFTLVPSFGLAPELPGMAAGPLVAAATLVGGNRSRHGGDTCRPCIRPCARLLGRSRPDCLDAPDVFGARA